MTSQEFDQEAREKETANDIQDGYMFTKEEYDNLHYEAEIVKKLKETKVRTK